MSRNGPFGQARAPQRRNPAEHDPYAPAPGQQQGGQWPPNSNGFHDPYANGSQQGYASQQYAPQETEPAFGYPPQQPQHQPAGHGHGQLPGFDRFAPAQPASYQAQPAQPQWSQQDPGNYDLGTYGAQGGYPQHEPQQPHFQQHAQDAGRFAPQQQGYAEPEAEYDEDLADGEDEPRSGRRWMLIVAALVGAIGLGGGLAYTYKILFPSSSGRAPIVKAIDFPNKVKPATGPETDKKLFTRLEQQGDSRPAGGDQAEQSDDRSAEATGGPRPVRVIPISPGGQQQVTTTGSVGEAPRPGGGQIVSVPGLMIDAPAPRGGPPQGMQGGQGMQQPMAPVRIAPPQQQQQQPQMPQQQVQLPEPQRKTAMVPVAPSTNQAVAPKVPAAVKVAVPKTSETTTGSTYTPVSNGYVAVLSSQKSRMDAMKAYAGMDQKYRDMLTSSTFDVQEVDLGEKGVWFRAVVGPPRSFDGAKKVCEDLKSAGYPSCWPTRY